MTTGTDEQRLAEIRAWAADTTLHTRGAYTDDAQWDDVLWLLAQLDAARAQNAALQIALSSILGAELWLRFHAQVAECLYCGATWPLGLPERMSHYATCPIGVARKLLAELE